MFSNDTDLNSINCNNINLVDDNFDDYDPEILNHARLMAWNNRSKYVAWHSRRWWDLCISEDKKKEIKPYLIHDRSFY